MKLYIDIDGVLLGKQNHELKIALGISSFLKISLNKFDCFWLTTHCKGDSITAIKYLSPYCDDEIINLLKKIKPTNFNVLKTDAINLKEEFIWIDDALLQSEMTILDENNKLSSWHQVNTYKNINDLQNFTKRFLI